jgi:Cytochrome oxidase complex assembly protein 1
VEVRGLVRVRRALIKRLFIFIAIVGVVSAALWYLSFVNESQAPVRVALRTATGSSGVLKALGGEPIQKRYVTGRVISGPDYGNADLTIHVGGPGDHGTLLEWAQNGFAGWHICSLIFTGSAGTEITVVSEAATHCDRE